MLSWPLFGRWHLSTVYNGRRGCYYLVISLPLKSMAWALKPCSWEYKWYKQEALSN